MANNKKFRLNSTANNLEGDIYTETSNDEIYSSFTGAEESVGVEEEATVEETPEIVEVVKPKEIFRTTEIVKLKEITEVVKPKELVKVMNSFPRPVFLDYQDSKVKVPGRGRITVKRSSLKFPLPNGITLIEIQ